MKIKDYNKSIDRLAARTVDALTETKEADQKKVLDQLPDGNNEIAVAQTVSRFDRLLNRSQKALETHIAEHMQLSTVPETAAALRDLEHVIAPGPDPDFRVEVQQKIAELFKQSNVSNDVLVRFTERVELLQMLDGKKTFTGIPKPIAQKMSSAGVKLEQLKDLADIVGKDLASIAYKPVADQVPLDQIPWDKEV